MIEFSRNDIGARRKTRDASEIVIVRKIFVPDRSVSIFFRARPTADRIPAQCGWLIIITTLVWPWLAGESETRMRLDNISI